MQLSYFANYMYINLPWKWLYTNSCYYGTVYIATIFILFFKLTAIQLQLLLTIYNPKKIHVVPIKGAYYKQKELLCLYLLTILCWQLIVLIPALQKEWSPVCWMRGVVRWPSSVTRCSVGGISVYLIRKQRKKSTKIWHKNSG